MGEALFFLIICAICAPIVYLIGQTEWGKNFMEE